MRKEKKVGEEVAFKHAVRPGYRYDRVREMRRFGAKNRIGSIGVHRLEKRSGGEREGPTREGRRKQPVDQARLIDVHTGTTFPRNSGGGGD